MENASKDKWVRQYIRTYLAILSVCLVVIIAMSIYISNAYQRVIVQVSGDNLLKRAQNQVDLALEGAYQAVLSFMVNNDALEEFMTTDAMRSDGFAKYRVMMSLKRDILRFKDAHPALYTINVFDATRGVMAFEDGILYLDTKDNAPLLEELGSLTLSTSLRLPDAVLTSLSPNYHQANDLVLYTRPYYLNTRKNADGVIMLWLDRAYFRNMLRDVLPAGDGTLAVYSAQGEVLFSTSQRLSAETPERMREISSESDGFLLSGGELLIGRASESTGWYYVAKMSSEGIGSISLLSNLRNFLIAFMIGYSVLMALGIFFTGRRAYSQIADLVKRVQLVVGDREGFNNSILYLSETFARMYEQNRSLQSDMERYTPLVRIQMASDLMYAGRVASPKEHLRNLRMIGAPLYDKGFAVLILKLFKEQSSESGWRRIVLAMQTALPEEMLAVEVKQDADTLAIIASFDTADRARQDALLRLFAQAFCGALDPATGQVSLCAGPIYPDCMGIPASYRAAADASRYAWLLGEGGIVYTQELFHGTHLDSVGDASSDIRRTASAFRAGDAKAMRENIDTFFLRLSAPSPAAYQMQMGMLFANILQTCAEFGVSAGQLEDVERSIMDILENPQSLAQSCEATKKLLQRLLQEKTSREGMRGVGKLATYITQYVNENYADAQLSLISAADYFHISESHVSHVFKDVVGVSFRNYVEQVRIERAKALLRNDDAVVGEIALNVGYANVQSFIRAFKRIEGISPGQYRDATLGNH